MRRLASSMGGCYAFSSALPLSLSSFLCSPLHLSHTSKTIHSSVHPDIVTEPECRGRGFTVRRVPGFKYHGKQRPGKLSPPRVVPETIPRPDYVSDGIPKGRVPRFPWDIEVKTAEEVEAMRYAGRVAREVLDAAGRAVGVGVATDEIDEVVHEESIKRGGYPSPLRYNGFPKSCCTSVNEVICHGIPDSNKLKDGDIVNVDVTVYVGGFHGDCSEMFLVGNVDDEGKRLVKTTWECMEKGIEICKPGVKVKQIGSVIEDFAKSQGFSVVRGFCGHGIGSIFHTTPNVMHYRNNEPAGKMKPGITFTIEPMINEGKLDSTMWPDDWTATTVDGKRSAQFEHTILITENGAERLTGKIESSPKYFWEA